MIPILAASGKAWQELMDAISDRFSWFLSSGIWMILGVVFTAAFVFFAMYAVMRYYHSRQSDGGNLW